MEELLPSVVHAATMHGKAAAVKKAKSLAERDEIMAEAQLMALVHPNIMTAHMLICNQYVVAFTMDLMKISLGDLVAMPTMNVSLVILGVLLTRIFQGHDDTQKVHNVMLR